MKKADKTAPMLAFAAAAALAGLAVYLYTSLTGYLAAAAMSLVPVACTAVALAALAAVLLGRLSGLARDAAVALASAMLLASLYQFVLARVALAADVYFIPVNYPAAEAAALHISIVGAVLYLLADLALIIAAAFTAGERKAA